MFWVTGEQDHSGFSGAGAQLVWGLRPNGSLRRVSDVERGRRCGCICPACERPLVAKKGRQLAEHFAHEGGNACSGAHETNAHAWAKEILRQKKKLWLPAGHAVAGEWQRETFSARYFEFEDARLEKRAGDIVPDVVLTVKGRELIVEILVTHACDEEKISKIREAGVSALEIDLSSYRHAETEEAVAEALIGGPGRGAPREWLYNAKVDADSQRLAVQRARQQARDQARKEADRRDRVAALVRAARAIRVGRNARTMSDLNTVEVYGLSEHTGIVRHSSTSAFRVPAKLWQSAVLARTLIPASVQAGTTFDVRQIIRELEDCVAPAFREEPPRGLQQEVSRALPGFRFPRAAVAEYLFDLAQRAVVEPEVRGSYRIADDLSFSLHQRTEELRGQQSRMQAAQDQLRRILNQVSAEEQEGFVFERWFKQPMPQIGLSLASIVEDEVGWGAVQQLLNGIERMFRPGQPPAEITLGLPLEGVIKRSGERERAAAEKLERERVEAAVQAQRDRVAWITREAVRILGEGRGLSLAR